MDALLSGITWSGLTQGGAVSVLILGLVAVFSGKLVPSSTVSLLTKQWERELQASQTRENDWRAAHMVSEAGRQVAADQVESLMEYARTMDQFIRSFPRSGRTRS